MVGLDHSRNNRRLRRSDRHGIRRQHHSGGRQARRRASARPTRCEIRHIQRAQPGSPIPPWSGGIAVAAIRAIGRAGLAGHDVVAGHDIVEHAGRRARQRYSRGFTLPRPGLD